MNEISQNAYPMLFETEIWKEPSRFGRTDGDFYFQVTNGRKLSSEIHGHDFWELLLVLSGECLHVVNGTQIRCVRGRAFLLSPEEVHGFLSQSAGTNVVALSVRCCEMHRWETVYGGLIATDKMRINRTLTLSPSACEVAQTAVNTVLAEERERVPLLRAFLGSMLSFFTVAEISCQTASDVFREKLAQCEKKALLQEGIPALLRFTHYSHSQLCRLFQEKMHCTPLEYITNLRLRYACEVLQMTSETVGQIAEECGFSSVSHFYRLFREQYGTTPEQFRKNATHKPETV